MLDDGITETMLPAVANPAEFNPPEWVLEAMQSAYARGLYEGGRRGSGLYPEGG